MKESTTTKEPTTTKELTTTTQLYVGLITVFMAALLSYHYVELSASKVLTRDLKEGETILENVGYVYFATLFQTTNFRDYDGQPLIFKDSRNKQLYLSMIRQIQKDIRWIVGNPGYIRYYGDRRKKNTSGQPNLNELAAIRGFLAIEAEMEWEHPLFGSLSFMCRTFGDRYYEQWRNSSIFVLPDSFFSFRPDRVDGESDKFVNEIERSCDCVAIIRSKSTRRDDPGRVVQEWGCGNAPNPEISTDR